MKSWMISLAILGSAAFGMAGCGSDEEQLSVENKEMCIVEVSKRLLACQQDTECEKGIVRFAGYCYNTAKGDQTDICRGGSYFFYQPLKELAESYPAVADLDKRQREILIRTGETYCVYNYN